MFHRIKCHLIRLPPPRSCSYRIPRIRSSKKFKSGSEGLMACKTPHALRGFAAKHMANGGRIRDDANPGYDGTLPDVLCVHLRVAEAAGRAGPRIIRPRPMERPAKWRRKGPQRPLAFPGLTIVPP
uniref:Uncharacterized protein n=1 Tax=Bursaphelenchus xylophilus TaxID=6326 RepID=A0A1I7SFP9_BURXY